MVPRPPNGMWFDWFVLLLGTCLIKESVVFQSPMERLWKHVFPALLQLACDVEQVCSKLLGNSIINNMFFSLFAPKPNRNFICRYGCSTFLHSLL